MLRFPNPGSTIENFVSVYGAAFERLNGRTVGLDDIVAAVVAANLATSSGYMGEQAVARSTRADRSRDPLYNQLNQKRTRASRPRGWNRGSTAVMNGISSSSKGTDESVGMSPPPPPP